MGSMERQQIIVQPDINQNEEKKKKPPLIHSICLCAFSSLFRGRAFLVLTKNRREKINDFICEMKNETKKKKN